MAALAFTGYPLDRADHLRSDSAALAALRARADARVAVFWRARPLVQVTEGNPDEHVTPAFLPAADVAEDAARPSVLLGLALDGAGVPTFAAALDPEREPDAAWLDGGARRFDELRALAPVLSSDDLAVLGAARGILAWHAAHGFCASCGAPTAPAHGGWKRECAACGKEHFPRVDPVAIMLITHDGRALLGRGRAWPERAYSCLAGYVEPGESLGDAARREAKEEAGVTLGDVSYIVSQPWPFPSSFMLGVRAEALDDQLTVDAAELADARWFTRDEIAEIMAGAHPLARTPPSFAVANYLLRWWLENG